MVLEILKKYDLDTIEKCQHKVPIILQSFEIEAVIAMGERSELPRVLLSSQQGEIMYN